MRILAHGCTASVTLGTVDEGTKWWKAGGTRRSPASISGSSACSNAGTQSSEANAVCRRALASNGEIRIVAPVSKPGDHVLLAAEMDCIVALSACPHDLPPVQLNGIDCTPRDVAYAVIPRG